MWSGSFFKELPRGAEENLAALNRTGIEPSAINWERVLAINYAELVGEGARMIDVGGKKGRHARIFSHQLKARQITIFEPNRAMVEVLQRRFCGAAHVTIVPKALGDSSGSLEFLVNHDKPGHSGFLARQGAAKQERLERVEVDVVRLDDRLELGEVDFIKIDVEGAELAVLRGGQELLARARPMVSVEYGSDCYSLYGYRPESLYELAFELGYTVCVLFGNPFETVEAWLGCVDRFYWDYFLMPSERVQLTEPLRERVRHLVARDIARQQRLRKLADKAAMLRRWM